MTDPTSWLQECGKDEAAFRLSQAELFLEVAAPLLDSGPTDASATHYAELAGKAAAEAICCVRLGARWHGGDLAKLTTHLHEATGDTSLAQLLGVLEAAKAAGRGPRGQRRSVTSAVEAVEAARALVEAARALVQPSP